MNSELKRFLQEIERHTYFALFTHKNPDGDAVGGVCAMALMLEKLGKKVDLFVQTPLKDTVQVLDLTGRFENVFTDRGQDCFIAIDCAGLDHLYLAQDLPADRALLVVDHHYTNTRYGSVHVIDENASSVGEVMYDVSQALRLPLWKELAEALYLSIVSDTWYFSFANTTPKSLRITAELMETGIDCMRLNERIKAKSLERFSLMCSALSHARVILDGKAIFLFIPDAGQDADTEGIVDSARNVKGCLLAALVSRIDKDVFRVSLRSNTDDVDVSAFASRFGGGGHKRAAGLTYTGGKETLFSLLEAFAAEVICHA